MREIIYGFKLSFSYFSILPVRFKNILNSPKIDRAFLFFIPFVGAFLAIVSSFLFLFLKNFLPNLYSAIFSASFYMFLYGFLHLEAVIDTIDALFASHSKKDAYKILKEPTVGAIGVVFAVLFLILKLSLISYLFINNLFLEFIAAALMGRLAIILPLKFFKIHEKSLLANSLKDALSNRVFLDMAILYFLLSFAFIKTKALFLFLILFIFSYFLSLYLYRKFNFINGDILGFIIEMSEFLILNIILAIS